jgi:hypothetical protein
MLSDTQVGVYIPEEFFCTPHSQWMELMYDCSTLGGALLQSMHLKVRLRHLLFSLL